MTLKNIPSTNPHKLSAERVARVTKALIRRLVEKGVLAPPRSAGTTKPIPPIAPQPEDGRALPEKAEWNGILDCRPKNIYRVFHLVKGGKDDGKS